MIPNEETAEDVQQDTENVEESEAQTENQEGEEDSTDWKAEAAKFRRLYEKEKTGKAPQSNPKPLQTEQPKGPDFETLATFVSSTRDLNDAELSELTGEAKELGVDPMKYLTSKAGKAHLEEYRRTNKSTEATPAPSNKVRLVGGKPADEILRDPEAPASDKQAAFEARMKRN